MSQFVSHQVDQGKSYAGFATFVLPEPEKVPEFIDGHDVEFNLRSEKSKFNQKRRALHDGVAQVTYRSCGSVLDSETMRSANVRSHMKGWANIDRGVHSVVGLDPNVTKNNLSFGGETVPKTVSYEQFNDASLRWKYGDHSKNPGQVKGTRGVSQMSKDIIRAIPRGASISGRYAGNSAT